MSSKLLLGSNKRIFSVDLMDTSINTRPLLQRSDTESDFDEDPQFVRSDVNDEDVAIKDTRPLFNTWIPADRYYISYIIFYFLGTIILLPWFFFVTAEEYWMYKFRPLDKSVAMIVTERGRSELQACFTSYLTIASTVPSTFFLIINPFISHRISLHIRVVGSLVLMLILFIVTTVFVKIDTDSWQKNFFAVTMVIVVVLNIGSAILQGGVFGVVGKFPSRYIAACVSGQALGGIMAAVAQIAALAVGASPLLSAFVYFIMADVFIFLAILAYLFLATSLFFKYYSEDRGRSFLTTPAQAEEDKESPSHSGSLTRPPISYTNILSKIWLEGFSVWFCFVVMFSVYPGITVLVKPTSGNPESLWNKLYFVPVVTFLLYSVCDYSGRLIAGVFQWPRGWGIAVLSISRIVFIPLVMLSNAQPRHHLPVLFHSDIAYVFIIILFGLTNGYLANITFISVPKLVAGHEQEIASSMLAAFLGIGIACGSLLNLPLIQAL